VDHFRVELNPIKTAGRLSHGGDGTGAGGAENGEAAGKASHDVAMAHPDLLSRGKSPEQGIGPWQ